MGKAGVILSDPDVLSKIKGLHVGPKLLEDITLVASSNANASLGSSLSSMPLSTINSSEYLGEEGPLGLGLELTSLDSFDPSVLLDGK